MLIGKELSTVDVIAAREDASGPLDPLKIAMAVEMREGENWRMAATAANGAVKLYVLDPDMSGVVLCDDGPEGYRRCLRLDQRGLAVITVEATRKPAPGASPQSSAKPEPDNDQILDRMSEAVDRVLGGARLLPDPEPEARQLNPGGF